MAQDTGEFSVRVDVERRNICGFTDGCKTDIPLLSLVVLLDIRGPGLTDPWQIQSGK